MKLTGCTAEHMCACTCVASIPPFFFFFFFIKTSRVRSLERAEPYKEEGNNKTAKEEEKGVAEVMAGLHGSNLPPLFLLLVCSWASDNGLARAVDVLHLDRPEGSALTSPWVPWCGLDVEPFHHRHHHRRLEVYIYIFKLNHIVAKGSILSHRIWICVMM